MPPENYNEESLDAKTLDIPLLNFMVLTYNRYVNRLHNTQN